MRTAEWKIKGVKECRMNLSVFRNSWGEFHYRLIMHTGLRRVSFEINRVDMTMALKRFKSRLIRTV